ncbi:MAG TPA: YihY/virulence factor BrkB family protein [Solirubrobacteraceae bacterium]|nr:YihY/virulence factor BrkB family protein [Solirubrobacteraceae bacterium]
MNSVRSAAVRARLLLQRSLKEFFDDDCPQRAAAISYYMLVSLFPLAILLVALFGLVADDDAARRRVIQLVLDNVPLREERGRADLEELLQTVTSASRGFGIAGLAGLLFAASAVMGAVRKALAAAWDVPAQRPFLQGKLLDFVLVFSAGAVVVVSVAATFTVRVTAAVGDDVGGGGFTRGLVLTVGQLIPMILAFGVFVLLFRIVPAQRPGLRDTWPGALLAAAGLELAKIGFSLYLEHFADYGAVYSSLGSIIAFMVFVFLAANIFLLGAEAASEWPAAREAPLAPPGDGRPLGGRLLDALRRQVGRRPRARDAPTAVSAEPDRVGGGKGDR